MASSKSLQTLDVVQNQSLHLILSAPKWTKICNLREETSLLSVLHRIQQLTTGLIARRILSDKQHTTPSRVIAAGRQDPNLFTKKTWARNTANALTALYMTHILHAHDTTQPQYTHPPPPWCPTTL